MAIEEWRLTETMNELHNYLVAAERREDAADKRSTGLIRAHEAGWKAVATAIERGLRGIADAIRDHGR